MGIIRFPDPSIQWLFWGHRVPYRFLTFTPQAPQGLMISEGRSNHQLEARLAGFQRTFWGDLFGGVLIELAESHRLRRQNFCSPKVPGSRVCVYDIYICIYYNVLLTKFDSTFFRCDFQQPQQKSPGFNDVLGFSFIFPIPSLGLVWVYLWPIQIKLRDRRGKALNYSSQNWHG